MFSFETILVCLVFGVPVDLLPVIGRYSFYGNVLFLGASLIAGYTVLSARRWYITRETALLVLCYLVMAIYMLGSLAHTADPLFFGVRKTALFIGVNLWCLLAAGIIASDPKRAWRYCWAALWFGVVFSIISAALPIITRGSILSLTWDYQWVSRVGGLAAIMGGVMLFYWARTIRQHVGLSLVVLLGVVVQLIGGGRAELLWGLICLFLLFAMGFKRKAGDVRIRVQSVWLLVAGMSMIGAVAGLILYGVVPRTLIRVMIILQGQSPDNASFSNRVARYSDFPKIFADAPLFGHGTGSWSFIAHDVTAPYPHNVFIELLVEQGIVGFLLFVIPLAAIFIAFVRRGEYRRDPIALAILLHFIYCTGLILTSGDLGIVFHFYTALGLLLYRSPSLQNLAAILVNVRQSNSSIGPLVPAPQTMTGSVP